MLVNDLDVRLISGGSRVTYYPYVLNPSNPGNAATTGDNTRDNAEMIYLASPASGAYVVQVSHKGTLAANQYYSFVVTGLSEGAGEVNDLVITIQSGNAVLRWSDVAPSYKIYGATTPFTTGTLLTTTSNTTWTDAATPSRPSPYFYYVTAVQ
jgi:hypothetical protein